MEASGEKHKDEHDKLKRRTDVTKTKPKEKEKQATITLLSSKVPYGPNHCKQKEFDQNIKQRFICAPISDLDQRIIVKTARMYAKKLIADEQKVKKHVKRLVRTKSSRLIGLTADMLGSNFFLNNFSVGVTFTCGAALLLLCYKLLLWSTSKISSIPSSPEPAIAFATASV